MESAPKNELSDPSLYPDEGRLQAALRGAFSAYLELLDLFTMNGMSWEWRYYADGKAWLCKVQKKRRTIVWLSAWSGFVQAAIYVPETLSPGLYDLPLRAPTKQRLRESSNIGRSKPCVFVIRDRSAIEEFETVLRYKSEAC